MMPEENGDDIGNFEETEDSTSVVEPATKPKKKSRVRKILAAFFGSVIVGRIIVAGVFLISVFTTFAGVRAALTPIFLPVYEVETISTWMPESATTDDKLRIQIQAEGCDSYRIAFYRRTPKLFSQSIVDPMRFERSSLPSISRNALVLSGNTPVKEISGPLSNYDLCRSSATVAAPQLSPGNYICVMQGLKGGVVKASQTHALQICNVGLMIREFGDRALVKAFDLRTLKPIEGGKIDVLRLPQPEGVEPSERQQPKGKARLLASNVTDKNGFAVLMVNCKSTNSGDAFSAPPSDLAYSMKFADSCAWVGGNGDEFCWTQSYNCGRAPQLQGATNGTIGSGVSEAGIVDVISDRPVYRLGQEVYLKGLMRKIGNNGLFNSFVDKPVSVIVRNPQGEQLQFETLRTGPFGDFETRFKIPMEGQTGDYSVNVECHDGVDKIDFSRNIEVIQYRKPEYEVAILPEQPVTIAGDKLKVKVKAKYFFGAPVANAKLTYTAISTPDFELRNTLKEVPEYYSFFSQRNLRAGMYYGGGAYLNGSAQTDKNGEAELVVQTQPLGEMTNPYDARSYEQHYNFSVQLTDLSRKTAEGTGAALVTPGQYAVVLETSGTVIKPGEKVTARIKAIDYQSKPVTNSPVTISLEKWSYNKTFVKDKILFERTVTTDAHGNAKVDLEFPPDCAGGRYHVFARAQDKSGHKISDSTYLSFTGPGGTDNYGDNNDRLAIELDKPVYKPGETVRAVIRSPLKTFGQSTGMVSISGLSLFDYHNIELNQQVTLAEFPLKKEYAPECQIAVAAANAKHEYQGTDTHIQIYPEPYLLNVNVAAGKPSYGPGDEAEVQFAVKLPDGKPAADTELIVSVADDSLFSIRSDDHDIRQSFYGSRILPYIPALISCTPVPEMPDLSLPPFMYINWLFPDHSSTSRNCRMDSCVMKSCAENAAAPTLQGATNGTIGPQSCDATVISPVPTRAPAAAPSEGVAEAQNSPRFAKASLVRSDFRDLAFWSAKLTTDNNGHALAKFKLPHNLTAWRVTVSAASKQSHFGSASTRFTVSKEVLARLSTPRFFTTDDQGSIIGIVHNYSAKKQTIRMQLQASKQFALGRPATQDVVVEPQGSAKIAWPVTVIGEGKGKLELKTSGSTDADDLVQTLPVRSFSFPAFATKNGILKDDALVTSLPLKMTPDARPGTGKFRLTVASSAIGPVLGSFDKLIDYPYGCTEQTMSRMMPSVVAMQLHKQLGLPIQPETLSLYKSVQRHCFIKLVEHQNQDGGWGWWRNDTSNPYLTAYVMEGLYLLRQAGFTVDQSMIDSGKQRLFQMSGESNAPWEGDDATDRAYVTYVSALWDNPDLAKNASKQLEKAGKLGPEGLSYLTLAFKKCHYDRAAEIVYKQLMSLSNKNWEFTTWEHTPALISRLGRGQALDYTYRFTGVESTALALQAVLAMEPSNEKLLSSIRRWIIFQHDQDGWKNTKTTARVFLALLDDEIAARAGKPTNFNASAVVNGKTLASFVFNKNNQYSAEQALEFALKGDEKELSIKKFGTGRLYYSSVLTYQRKIVPGQTVVPRSSPPDLTVERKFYRLERYMSKDNIEATRAVPIAKEGVHAGDTILMKLFINSASSLPYVMVDAALPSGAEVQSNQVDSGVEAPSEPVSSESGSESAPVDESLFSYWWTHQDILDDRIVFFATEIPAGKSSFQALLRMEMPGKFNVNPVTFQGMYSQSIRGYSDADQIVVQE